MGFNTVAVLYNDFNFETFPNLGKRIGEAIRGYSFRDRDNQVTNFGAGIVISQAHADNSQVVIVGRNTGQRVSKATDLDWFALEQMKECLERHGYRIIKRRKPVSSNRQSGKSDGR